MGRFSDLVAPAREKAGLTQKQVATAIGVTQGLVAQWELGDKWPSAKFLPRVATVLKLDVGALLAAIEVDQHHRSKEQERQRVEAGTVEVDHRMAKGFRPKRGTPPAIPKDAKSATRGRKDGGARQ